MKIRDFRHNRWQLKGFTLVELMVTLSILAILLAIGVPSLQGFLASRQAQAQADTFASALRFARSEALKRSRTVTMCLTTIPDSTTPTCNANGTDWNTGWLVFVGTTAVDPNVLPNLLLKVQQPLTGNTKITGRNGGAPPSVAIQFEPDGLLFGVANGSFEVTPANNDTKSCVRLSRQGRVTTLKTACPPPPSGS